MSANRWPKGRKIPGSGRKKGSRNKPKKDRLTTIAKRVAGRIYLPDVGIDPDTDSLDLLQAVYKRGDLPLEVRMHAARCALPYEHPALRSIDFKGSMLHGVSGALLEFIRGNATATRSFLGFDRDDQDAPPAAHNGALPHS